MFGFVADRLGRKTIFTFSLIWYTIASVVMAFQSDAFGLNLWRFIAGVGIGVELVTIDAYIAELVPAALRGRAFAYNSAIQFVAVPVVALIAWLLAPHAPLRPRRMALGRADRLARRGVRLADPARPARKPALAGGARTDGGGRSGACRRWKRRAASAADAARRRTAAETERGRRFVEIWQAALSHAHRHAGHLQYLPDRRVFMAFRTGCRALLIKQGISVTQSLQYTFIIAIAAPFGPLLAAALSDRVERKWLIVAAAFAIAVFGLLFGQTTTPLSLIALGVLLTLSNNTLSFAFHGYQAELYPTRIRALAVGFVYSWSRLSAVFSAFAIAFSLQWFGVAGVFTLIAGSMLDRDAVDRLARPEDEQAFP